MYIRSQSHLREGSEEDIRRRGGRETARGRDEELVRVLRRWNELKVAFKS
jgi:hypothetical protein